MLYGAEQHSCATLCGVAPWQSVDYSTSRRGAQALRPPPPGLYSRAMRSTDVVCTVRCTAQASSRSLTTKGGDATATPEPTIVLQTRGPSDPHDSDAD